MNELEEKLNCSPNSIHLHDGCLLALEFNKKRLILKFMIDEYTYSVNSKIFDSYTNDYPILYEIFEEVSIVNFTFDSSFDFMGAEVMGNKYENGIFTLTLLDVVSNYAHIEFKFKKFKWILDKVISNNDVDKIYVLLDDKDSDDPLFQISNNI